MATGKALNGKPYAGNPHVRFDEGEVASAATPRRGSLLYRKWAWRGAASVAAVATVAMAANARSLLYYYDFDKVENNALVYTGINKGTGSLELTLKKDGSSALGYALDGAFDSCGVFKASSFTSLWLGNGSASLGCGTTRGFTISFWLKPAAHEQWTDFFGYRVGGIDYRLEHHDDTTGPFRIYYGLSGNVNSNATLVASGKWNITGVQNGEWKHIALVFKPNATDNRGTCSIYVGGMKFSDVAVHAAGDLTQLHIGSWVRDYGSDRKNKAGSNASIDELAVFDYPATDEQVEWLGKYRPAQPSGGPGRQMPFAMRFERSISGSGGGYGVQPDNSGTGSDAISLLVNGYAQFMMPPNTALNSSRCFHLNTQTTFLTSNTTGANGLGATFGSGFSLSFWLHKPSTIPEKLPWTDFMSFRIGDRYERLEWLAGAAKFGMYGTKNNNTGVESTAGAWEHVCITWNNSSSSLEFYKNGAKVDDMTTALADASAAEAFKSLTVGRKVYNNDGTWRLQNEDTTFSEGTLIDEIALFNHSLSTNQIAWLGTHIPCLPPLDATNLVRTVAASGAWAGGRASWAVREWDGADEAWVDTTRTTIYPALEDTEVEALVTLADGVEITNDTFVTPKRLALAAAAESAAATLKTTADSRFAPQALEIGDGLQLTVPLYAVNVGGALAFGVDSKIVFDTANFNVGGTTNALAAGSFTLPEGETDADVLSHFDVTDSRFAILLSADRKTVFVVADAIPTTATWTGAGDGTSLDSAGNWDCRNVAGAAIDAVPCELTRVVVCSGTAAMNAPAGTVLPWRYRSIEAGSVTLSAPADWRGIPSVAIPAGVTVNLGGHNLYLNETVRGSGTFTDTAATGGELHFDIPGGVTFTNEQPTSQGATRTFALAGTLKMVKDGAGVFVASREHQPYTGGTQVAAGTLKYGGSPSAWPLGGNGINNASSQIVAVGEGATLDVNGKTGFGYTTVVFNGGTVRGSTTQFNCAKSLSADSHLDATGDFAIQASDKPIVLGGHVLEVSIAPGKTLKLDNCAPQGPGKIRIVSGGYLQTMTSACDARTVDFAVGCALNLGYALNVRDYEAEFGADYNGGTASMNVYGTFKPASAHNYFHGCEMMDGSTIDLSACTSALPLVSEFADGAKTLDFGSNRTVYVKLGSRRVASKDALVSWTSKPANIDSVMFRSAAGEPACSFIKNDDGLYIKRGFMILVR